MDISLWRTRCEFDESKVTMKRHCSDLSLHKTYPDKSQAIFYIQILPTDMIAYSVKTTKQQIKMLSHGVNIIDFQAGRKYLV